MNTRIGVILVLLISLAEVCFGQNQRVAYVDTDYIFSKMPQYREAQMELDRLAADYQGQVDRAFDQVEKLKRNLSEERILMTADLVQIAQEEIEEQTRKAEELAYRYFSEDGELIAERKRLVRPIQDLVFNVINDIAQKRRFDFVFDRAGDVVILYSNKKLDISELVLEQIGKNIK